LHSCTCNSEDGPPGDTKTGSNLLQWPVVEVETLCIGGRSFR
jgi:hypothetical protein